MTRILLRLTKSNVKQPASSSQCSALSRLVEAVNNELNQFLHGVVNVVHAATQFHRNGFLSKQRYWM